MRRVFACARARQCVLDEGRQCACAAACGLQTRHRTISWSSCKRATMLARGLNFTRTLMERCTHERRLEAAKEVSTPHKTITRPIKPDASSIRCPRVPQTNAAPRRVTSGARRRNRVVSGTPRPLKAPPRGQGGRSTTPKTRASVRHSSRRRADDLRSSREVARAAADPFVTSSFHKQAVSTPH